MPDPVAFLVLMTGMLSASPKVRSRRRNSGETESTVMKIDPRSHSAIVIAGRRGQGDGGRESYPRMGNNKRTEVVDAECEKRISSENRCGLALPCGETSISVTFENRKDRVAT